VKRREGGKGEDERHSREKLCEKKREIEVDIFS
jgi:hypothetical protein